jgi:rhodanese-related sulfurtransferase
MPSANASRLAALACALLCTVPAGCDVKTSDRDLVYLDPPGAVEQLNLRGGLFEKQHHGVWMDARPAAAYAVGHIKGAVNVPLVEVLEAGPARLAGHDLVVVYGDTFQDPVAKAAAKKLLEAGFKKDCVFVMEGGLRAWQKDGYSLVTGSLPDGGDPKAEEKPKSAPGGVEVPEQGVK